MNPRELRRRQPEIKDQLPRADPRDTARRQLLFRERSLAQRAAGSNEFQHST